MFLDEIAGNETHFQLKHFFAIENDGFRTLRAITPRHFRRNGLTIGDNRINDAAAHVVRNRAQMIAEGVLRGFAGLRHEVGDVHARSFGTRDRVGNFRNQQIGNNAGVQRAGTQKNKVGFLDGFDRGGERTNTAGVQCDFANGNAAARDARFALYAFAIGQRGHQVDIRKRGREDTPANGEHFAGNAYGFSKIAGDVRESREEKIAEVVATQAATGVKTILEQAAQKRFVFRKGDHAVANVTRGKHAIFPAQAAGASAIVGDGDNGGEISDGPFESGVLIAAANYMFLQSAQQCGQAGASTERYNAQASGRTCL